jgi:GNAT superfamily N-acetyltransferase
MVSFRLQSSSEVKSKSAELRGLTEGDPQSDMNRLLDSLEKGEDPLLVSTLAEEAGRVVGWATCEHFMTSRRHHHLVNVFVLPGYRKQGVARRLLNDLLSEVERAYPGVKPEAGDLEDPFWSRFPVTPVSY